MATLNDLPNIGEVLAQQLRQVGIETPQQLRAAGSRDAFLRIRLQVDETACLHKLYAVQGAVEGVRYTQLDAQTKQQLKQFFNSLTAQQQAGELAATLLPLALL